MKAINITKKFAVSGSLAFIAWLVAPLGGIPDFQMVSTSRRGPIWFSAPC